MLLKEELVAQFLLLLQELLGSSEEGAKIDDVNCNFDIQKLLRLIEMIILILHKYVLH